MKTLHHYIALIIALSIIKASTFAQSVPNPSENIDFLVTYGKNTPKVKGDDDNVQVIFFLVPPSQKGPVYIRVFDPEIGGKHDDVSGAVDTKVKYSLYGGVGAFSNKDARGADPTGNYKSGILLATKTFGADPQLDDGWHVFGPVNPMEGEKVAAVGGNVFKMIVEGLAGNDGNVYRFFLSSDRNKNVEVEGANAFAFEYTFRLLEKEKVTHIYPFIEKSVVSITQHNYDFDADGEILIYSISKRHHKANASGDIKWASSKHIMTNEEKNTTIDLQILKKTTEPNNIVVYITNQYNEPVPFYAVPIGGPPKYKYKTTLKVN